MILRFKNPLKGNNLIIYPNEHNIDMEFGR